MNKKNALITGAAGFIGRHLTKSLRQAGWNVLPVDNLSVVPLGKIPEALWRTDVLELSPSDLSSMDLVVHLAAQKNVPKSFEDRNEIAKNVIQDRHVFEISATAAVPRVFYASSCEVYGITKDKFTFAENHGYNPMSPYAVSKVSAELLANVYQALSPRSRFLGLRFFNTYGPDEGVEAVIPRFIADVMESGILTIEGTGRQKRDFSYISDVVEIICRLADRPDLPSVINIGSGISHSIGELAHIVLEHAGFGHIRYINGRRNEIPEFRADTSLLDELLAGATRRTGLVDGVGMCMDILMRERTNCRIEACNSVYELRTVLDGAI